MDMPQVSLAFTMDAHVKEVIERQGLFHISKDVGMFEACQSNASQLQGCRARDVDQWTVDEA